MAAACYWSIVPGMFVFFVLSADAIVKASVVALCVVLLLAGRVLRPYSVHLNTAALDSLIACLSTSSWCDQSFAEVIRPTMTDAQMRDFISPRWDQCSMAEMTARDFGQWFDHMRTTAVPPLLPLRVQGTFLRQVGDGLWLAIARLEDPQAMASATVQPIWATTWVPRTLSNLGPLERLFSRFVKRTVANVVNSHRRATGREGPCHSLALTIPTERFFRIFVSPASVGLLSTTIPIRCLWVVPRRHVYFVTLEGYTKKRIVLRFTDGSSASFFVVKTQRTSAKLVVDGF